MAKRGRPHKPYRASDGKFIDGLSRRPDGRWHILATGELFTEPDEAKALKRFRNTCPAESIFISVSRSPDPSDHADVADQMSGESDLVYQEHEDDTTELGYDLDSKKLWTYFAEQLAERPEYVAMMTGIPSLAN